MGSIEEHARGLTPQEVLPAMKPFSRGMGAEVSPSARRTTVEPTKPADTSKKYKPRGCFPFLQLPGELRNRIYELFRRDCLSRTRQQVLSLKHVQSDATPYGATIQKHRPYLNFTRVCRQLREEFHLVEYTTIKISLRDLKHHISTFHSSTEQSVTATHQGYLIINLDIPFDKKGIDILPVLKLLFNAPGFHCDFVSNDRWARGKVSRMLREHQETWKEQVRNGLVQVLFHAGAGSWMTLVFKKEHYQPWMAYTAPLDPRRRRRLAFLKELGFETRPMQLDMKATLLEYNAD